MAEKFNVPQSEAVNCAWPWLPDDAVPLCATIKSDPGNAESPVAPAENEESLLELVAVKREEYFNSDDTIKIQFLNEVNIQHNEKIPLVFSDIPKTEDESRRMTFVENRAYQRRIETLDQRAIRLEKNRLRVMASRQNETEEQKRKRRQKCAQRASKLRANETEEQRRQRLEEARLRAAERRKNMTPEERELWRIKNRIQTRERRQKEDEIQKILRRHNNAIRAYLKRSYETEEERMERRMKDAMRAAERRKTETPEEREERLRKDRERVRLRRREKRTAETPKETKTIRRNRSKYCDETRTMLSILKSVQDYLNHNEIKKEDITRENINRSMVFVKSRHPDVNEAYIEEAVNTFLSSRDSDSPDTNFSNDYFSLLSMSDSSQSGSIFSEAESSYCENFEAITEEIEIKQEPLEERTDCCSFE